MRSQSTAQRLSSRAGVNAHSLFGSVELTGIPIAFKKGAEIYGDDETADYVYKIINGSARSYKILGDGRRQIQNFHFSGDIFGFENKEKHSCSVEAIADSTVLMVRRSLVLATASRDSDVARRLWLYASTELGYARDHAMLLVKTAQERVASFLIQLADRSGENALDVPMSRQDIADYLGLTIETVSRSLSQFQSDSSIELPSSRRIVLRNRPALSTLSV